MNLAHDKLTSSPVEQLKGMGILVLERGWLSSNNILLLGDGDATVVDTGYATHAALTVELVRRALEGRPLARILNTHLHSDHCGGNAALQAAWPAASIAIPPGLADAVRAWDTVALTYEPTGQQCPRFDADALLVPGETLSLGGWQWQVHGADGHDPHAIVLFEPTQRILMSADALWANGFGVVFPELDDASGFSEVADTLRLIESLAPSIVIPGHGPVFAGPAVAQALQRAHSRLAQFVADPARHRRHALKVLVKFKLLEWQRCHQDTLTQWFLSSAYFERIGRRDSAAPLPELLSELVQELVQSGALARNGQFIVDC
jgi:glyoxylase-like metal-dependent hydrolase (beta-lactamase superfamily II)